MDPGGWLDARPAMPRELRWAVDVALDRAPAAVAAPVEAQLAEAGLAALSRVGRAASERSTAAELLAADTLLTYACEAAAESGPEALERLTAQLDYACFARLLEPSIS